MTRRCLLTAAATAAGALFALPGVAVASDASGGVPLGADFAVGDVITLPFRPLVYRFDAHSGPSGAGASGTVTWADRSILFGGPVTCLTVTGNRATIGFENQHDLAADARGGLLFVEDNGAPGAGRDAIVGDLVFGPAAPAICPSNTVVYDPLFHTVTSGDLTVHDAPSLPTSKEQCKKGGWQDFQGVKNQGDCVAIVATGGRNRPAGWPPSLAARSR
jgi:hypothetical protein